MDVQAAGSTFLKLAIELQVKVLQKLGLGDLTRCTRVCKQLRSLVTAATALQYKMELERAGMVDGPAEVPLPVKLEKIRARNAAWDTAFPLHVVVQPPPRSGFVPSLPGGVFFRLGTIGDAWTLHRPAWPEVDTSGGLEDRSISLTSHEISTTGMSSSDQSSPCAVNPEEDLVVFVKGRSVPDGIPQCVIISIAQNKIDTSWTSQLVFSDLETPVMDFVQSVGDLLSWSRINVFYSAGQGELRVMNWQTGAIVWRSLWTTSGRCLLLDTSHVMVVDHKGLFIYEFDPHTSASIPPDWATEASCLLHLEFPAFGVPDPDIMFLRTHEPGARYFRSDRPFFREDPDITVLAVYFNCLYGHNMEDLILVIPLATIHARLSQPQIHDQQETVRVPWSDWGPDGTRLLRLARQPNYITTWGSRVAISLAPPRSGLDRDVFIVDVRPHSRKDSFGGGAQDVPIAMGKSDAPIDASDTMSVQSFAETVTTRLPYRMAHIKACLFDVPNVIQSLDGRLTHDGMVFMVSSRPG
ncbi:hypothetical protein OH76DRAFT_1412838 [Lentinus brumalis]|uniref:F-box domain-containing protein n=1 Tax=Lentinus brumalis TaxID=2498619 RepID=A0A371CK62_9APHY|nr:hypothetical protein OH76DRAFT_1412838 [Polyporus brumalis]